MLTISRIRYLIVSEQQANQRVDNFLIGHFKGVPKSRLYRAIRGGEVRVNKKRVKADTKLMQGDEIRLPPLQQPHLPSRPPPGKLIQQLLLDAVIYENDVLLILNKPAGMAVHRGTKIDFSVIDVLRYARADLDYLELVHRLDKQTSGCLLLAKTFPVRRQLQQLFLTNDIKKTYLALLKGRWKGGQKKLELPVVKMQSKSGEWRVGIATNGAGKRAHSIFRPLQVRSQVTLVEVEIATGRTHQIRVHAAHLGYPIVGDNKYGDREFNKKIAKKLGSRLFLHSASLEFALAGEKIAISACLDNTWYYENTL